MKKIFDKPKIRVSRTAVIIWRIDLTILMIPVALVIVLIDAFFPVIAGVLGVAAVIVYAVTMIFYIPMYCRSLSYTFEKNNIVVRKGVFYKRSAVVPISSIQYCVIIQGLLQKRFKRCTVALMLAGSFILVRQISLSEGDELVAFLNEEDPGGGEEDGQ